MLESDEGEAFNCDREIGVPLQLKIWVLDRFQAQDPKIGSFVKYGSLRALVKMFTIILISDMWGWEGKVSGKVVKIS